jgi:membrane protease YdiL (CAAX protease family)
VAEAESSDAGRVTGTGDAGHTTGHTTGRTTGHTTGTGDAGHTTGHTTGHTIGRATRTSAAGTLPFNSRIAGWEIVVVFAVSLGASGVSALVSLIGSLTGPAPLSSQHALLNGSLAPGRPWFDLALQVTGIILSLAPVALVLYMLARSGESPSAIGLDLRTPGTDILRGIALAAVVGGSGLLLYLAAFHLGANLNVVPEALPAVWWRIPVLIASAAKNGILEETVVLGYLLHRLDQLGWPAARAIAVSALVRGSYHLYQGFGGFVGNAAMGVIFGLLYRRWGRVTPMIVAHTIMDAVAFVGYAALHGRVSWLP